VGDSVETGYPRRARAALEFILFKRAEARGPARPAARRAQPLLAAVPACVRHDSCDRHRALTGELEPRPLPAVLRQQVVGLLQRKRPWWRPRSVGPGPAPRRATCLRNARGGSARGGCGHQNGAQSFGATPHARAPRSAGWLPPAPLRRRRPRPRRMSTKWLNRPSGCGARPRRGERRPAGLRPGARGARERRWRGRAGRGARACARASEGVVVHPQLRQCPAARQHRRERARARIRHARVRHVEQRQRARPLVALAVLCPSRCCRRQPARERCHPVVAQRIRSVLAPPP